MPTRKATFTWASVSTAEREKLLDLIGGDGHTIWSAPGLIEEGAAPAWVDAFTHVEKSDGSLKGSIFTDRGIAPELRGVYGLTVIRSLAGQYDVHSTKYGRGSEARELTEGIRAAIELEKAAALG